MGDHDHALIVLIRECLNNLPACRPIVANILRRLEELSEVAEDDKMGKDKIHLMTELQRVSEELQNVQSRFEELQVCLAMNIPYPTSHVFHTKNVMLSG